MTEQDMFSFHEKEVIVELADGTKTSGMCWCYSELQAREDDGLPEAYIEVGPGRVFLLSEIKAIKVK